MRDLTELLELLARKLEREYGTREGDYASGYLEGAEYVLKVLRIFVKVEEEKNEPAVQN